MSDFVSMKKIVITLEIPISFPIFFLLLSTVYVPLQLCKVLCNCNENTNKRITIVTVSISSLIPKTTMALIHNSNFGIVSIIWNWSMSTNDVAVCMFLCDSFWIKASFIYVLILQGWGPINQPIRHLILSVSSPRKHSYQPIFMPHCTAVSVWKIWIWNQLAVDCGKENTI